MTPVQQSARSSPDAIGVSRLSDTATDLLRDAMSENTRRACASDLRAWETWCAGHGIPSLPAGRDDLVSHLADLAAAGASESALNRRLAAILKAHRLLGQPVPDTARAREAIKGAPQTAGRR